jgi:hypothetical protein
LPSRVDRSLEKPLPTVIGRRLDYLTDRLFAGKFDPPAIPVMIGWP